QKKRFWVYDSTQSIWRKSQPYNEAVEKDFQKMDHFIGLDPNILEKEFAKIECQAIETINKVISKKQLPSTLSELSDVICLIGLLAVRIPFMRERAHQFYRDAISAQKKKIFGTPCSY